MKGIQFILMTGVAFISLYFFIQLKKKLLDFLVLGIMVVTSIILILWPDLTSIIAHKLGVGRGVDLLFYVAILIFWFVVLKLYARIRKLEKEFTHFVRRDALNNAIETANNKDDEKQP